MDTPADRRRDAKIAELLETALELVGDEGLDGLTVARLAKRMHWTKGALYRYYDSKDQLIAALNAHVLDRWSTRADHALQDHTEPLPRLRALLATLIELSASEPQAFGLIALTMAHPANLVASIQDAVHIQPMMGLLGRFAVELESAMLQGSLTPGDPLQRALTLVFSGIGLLQVRKLARLAPQTFDADRLAATAFDDLLDAWSPR